MRIRLNSIKLVTALLSTPLSTSFSRCQSSSFYCNPSRFMSASAEGEVDLAAAAASTDPAVNPFAPTFFDKIVKKEIPANIIYEDDLW